MRASGDGRSTCVDAARLPAPARPARRRCRPSRLRRRRPRDARRRRVRDDRPRRSRVLQLHRLRTLRAADAADRRVGRGEGRPALHAARRGADARTSARSGPTRCTCASGRGRRANFDIQVGRVPPTFGAFARRTYASDNPLIGYPLAYQYLTTMRADALAGERRRAAAEAQHGLAACATPSASRTRDGGVPLVSAFRWDTGVQVHGATPGSSARRRRSPPGRCRTRSFATTTAAVRWPDASSCVRSAA